MTARGTNERMEGGRVGGRRAGPGDGAPAFRLAIGLGDAAREQVLLRALSESGDFVVAARCLAADEVLACVRRGDVDAALVATDLHRLSDGTLEELARARTPVVLLAPRPEEGRWRAFAGRVLPADAELAAVRAALLAAVRGETPRTLPHPGATETPAADPQQEPEAAPPAPADGLSVLAVASGPGSPGRTTVAVSLAAALGAVAPTVLVDADVFGPSVAAHLDLDPTRNLYMLGHAAPSTPGEWERAIAQETQPLALSSPHAVAVCGVPKPEMRTAVSAGFLEQLVAELQRRYRYVVLDIGADLLGPDAAVHRAAVRRCQQVLFVVATDVVGLRQARTGLDVLKAHAPIDPQRVAVLLNRHDRRHHYGRGEIEFSLEVPAAAVVPYDHGAAQRALGEQRPLVVDERSRAGGALLELADRVHGGRIRFPAAATTAHSTSWQRWLPPRRPRPPWTRRGGLAPDAGTA